MTSNHERSFDDLRSTLGEYGRIVRHRWRLGFIGLGLVSSLAFWYSQYLPRRYHASTIFERRDDAVLRNLVNSNSPYSYDNLKSTLVMDMTGSRAMAEAAAQVGLLSDSIVPAEGPLPGETVRALDAALAQHKLAASVQILQSSPGLDTIRLACEANNPTTAQRFVVGLRDRYIAVTRARITEILVGTRKFFESEVERFRTAAAETNRTLREQFKEFPGVDPTDLASAGARLETLQQERGRLAQERAQVEAQIAAREEFLTSTVPLVEGQEPTGTDMQRPAPPALPESDDVMARAIRDVEQKIAELMIVSRMTEEHPTVQGLLRKRDGLYAARETLRTQRATAASGGEPATTAAKIDPRVRPSAERLRVELELDALRRQLDVVRQGYEHADRRATEFASLYDQLLHRSEELRQMRDKLDQDATTVAMWRQYIGQLDRILSAESEQRGTQFALLEDPKDPGRAVSPRVASVFAVCSGAGLAIAALLVAVAELLDRSFRTAGQVTRALGIPVLECIGVIPTPKVRRQRFLSRLRWWPALGVLLGALAIGGGLAYLSLESPLLHERVIHKVDGLLDRLGTPQTGLLGSSHE